MGPFRECPRRVFEADKRKGNDMVNELSDEEVSAIVEYFLDLRDAENTSHASRALRRCISPNLSDVYKDVKNERPMEYSIDSMVFE